MKGPSKNKWFRYSLDIEYRLQFCVLSGLANTGAYGTRDMVEVLGRGEGDLLKYDLGRDVPLRLEL